MPGLTRDPREPCTDGWICTEIEFAVGSAVRLDSSPSAFADTIAWTVSACTGTPANPGLCDTSLPVVGSTNTVAWFPLGAAGTYKLTLTLDGGKEPLATATPYYYQVQ